MARMYRDCRVGTIGGGSSEIMREIISKMVIDAVDYKKAETSFTYSGGGNSNISHFNDDHELFRKTLRDFLNKEIKEVICSTLYRYLLHSYIILLQEWQGQGILPWAMEIEEHQ